MKKVLLTIGIIAVLAGFAFVGMAAYPGKDVDRVPPVDRVPLVDRVLPVDRVPPIDPQLAALQSIAGNISAINSKLANVTVTEPVTGYQDIGATEFNMRVYQGVYNHISHVAITIGTEVNEMGTGGEILVAIRLGGVWWKVDDITSAGVYQLPQYDTDGVRIVANGMDVGRFAAAYEINITPIQ